MASSKTQAIPALSLIPATGGRTQLRLAWPEVVVNATYESRKELLQIAASYEVLDRVQAILRGLG